MANFGLELLYQFTVPSLRDRHDAVLLFVHWKLVSQGFRCVRAGDDIAVVSGNLEGSEILPTGWNENREVYQLLYVKNEKSYLLKALRVDASLLVTFADLSEDRVSSISVNCEDEVKTIRGNFREVYTNTTNFSKLIQEELVSRIVDKQVKYSPMVTGGLEAFSVKDQVKEGSSIGKTRELEDNPFAVGGSDLNPLGRGQGGMLMDPRHQGFEGGHPPQLGIPPNLPHGAVPPGARFDPFGPVPPGYIPPPPRFNPPGVQPPPRGGFAGPDPDHLPPPGFGDMFM